MNGIDKERFGAFLAALRKEKGLTQRALADRLYVSDKAVSKWERGDTVPSTDTLRRIAELFHVSVDYLLGRPAALCQSCGMSLVMDSDKGTRKDGSGRVLRLLLPARGVHPGPHHGRTDRTQSAGSERVEPGGWTTAHGAGGKGAAYGVSADAEAVEGIAGAAVPGRRFPAGRSAPPRSSFSKQIRFSRAKPSKKNSADPASR